MNKIIKFLSVLAVLTFLTIPAVSAASNVAILTVFSDPTPRSIGSSGSTIDIGLGAHSWITVKNIASTPITVGALNGIAPGKTVSIGTYGNQKEHNGIWYNLEARDIKYDNKKYSGRVSRTYSLTATQLNTLNKNIKNNDWWSLIHPCSYWAGMQWNAVVPNVPLSIGIPSTPITLAITIKATSGWTTRAAVPFDYPVYYANGAGTPKRSIIYYGSVTNSM
jgi:hypothetical protein